MKAWGVTDVGLKRRDNQDTYAFEHYGSPDSVIAVVCDGMGGVQGGQVASTLAVSTFLDELHALAQSQMTVEDVCGMLTRCVERANLAVYERSLSNMAYHGMGTTLVTALATPKVAVIGNVGDSRAYHISPSGIRRVSRDHSVVEEMIEAGEITREEARTHPNRNLITRALGPDRNLACDTFAIPFEKGECLLLCSDGLTGTVLDEELFDAVRATDDGAAALENLLALSRSRGAPDNVTAVLIRNDGEEVRADG